MIYGMEWNGIVLYCIVCNRIEWNWIGLDWIGLDCMKWYGRERSTAFSKLKEQHRQDRTGLDSAARSRKRLGQRQIADRTRPEQTRTDRTRPDQTRTDQIQPKAVA